MKIVITKYNYNKNYVNICKHQFYSDEQAAFLLDVHDIKNTYEELLYAYDLAVEASQSLKKDIDRLYKIKN